MKTSAIKESILQRFDALIEEGENKSEKMRKSYICWDSNLAPLQNEDPQFFAWISNIENLLAEVLPEKTHVRQEIADMRKLLRQRSPLRPNVYAEAKGLLLATKEGFESDLFDSFHREISNTISMDYLQLAEDVFSDKSCKYSSSHIPAAVLAGVTLERYLRGLCGYTKPPISIVKRNGKHKCMNEMIDDLRRQDVVNETDAKQLRVWAGMRNDAAHGNVENLDRYDVEQMINGVRHFLERSAK